MTITNRYKKRFKPTQIFVLTFLFSANFLEEPYVSSGFFFLQRFTGEKFQTHSRVEKQCNVYLHAYLLDSTVVDIFPYFLYPCIGLWNHLKVCYRKYDFYAYIRQQVFWKNKAITQLRIAITYIITPRKLTMVL